MPYLQKSPLYFLSYLIVNSIQMGANIDYAIVISSHYSDLKTRMKPKQAIVAALNEAFPTIFTSGTILAVAGALIQQLTTNPIIASIGNCLSRGTIISIVLVLAVLPQILVVGDIIIEKTSFQLKSKINLTPQNFSGLTRVNGLIRGQVNGTLEGNFSGFVRGDMSVTLITGGAESVSDEEDPGPDAVEVSAIEEKNPPGLPQKDDRTNDHAKSEEQNKEEKGSAEDEEV